MPKTIITIPNIEKVDTSYLGPWDPEGCISAAASLIVYVVGVCYNGLAGYKHHHARNNGHLAGHCIIWDLAQHTKHRELGTPYRGHIMLPCLESRKRT